jgi:hypothetical protein
LTVEQDTIFESAWPGSTRGKPVVQDGGKPGGDQGVAVVDAAVTAYLDLAGVLDPAKEAAKLQKQEKEVRLTP